MNAYEVSDDPLSEPRSNMIRKKWTWISENWIESRDVSTVEDVTKTRFFVYQEEIQHRTLHESWKVTLILFIWFLPTTGAGLIESPAFLSLNFIMYQLLELLPFILNPAIYFL